MVSIFNPYDYTFSPTALAAIRNSIPNGIVAVHKAVAVYSNFRDNDAAPIFDIYDEEENYLFSIDTDGDVIFEKK